MHLYPASSGLKCVLSFGFPIAFLTLKDKVLVCVRGGPGLARFGIWVVGRWVGACCATNWLCGFSWHLCVCVCVCVPALHLLLISVTGDTTCISCNTVGAWRFLYRLGPPYLQTLIFFNPLLIHYAFESFAWKSVLLWSATLLMMYFLQNEQHWDTVYLLKGDTRHYRSYQ